MDDDVKPLKKLDYSDDHDSEDKVEPVKNEMSIYMASKPSWVRYGSNSLLEQWRETYGNADFDYDPYDNDMYKPAVSGSVSTSIHKMGDSEPSLFSFMHRSHRCKKRIQLTGVDVEKPHKMSSVVCTGRKGNMRRYILANKEKKLFGILKMRTSQAPTKQLLYRNLLLAADEHECRSNVGLTLLVSLLMVCLLPNNFKIHGWTWSYLLQAIVELPMYFRDVESNSVDDRSGTRNGNTSPGQPGYLGYHQQQIKSMGCTPNCFTCSSIIAACANLSILTRGQQIHGGIFKRGHQQNLPLANSVIDMYAKSGSIQDSKRIENNSPFKCKKKFDKPCCPVAMRGLNSNSLRTNA
ncbi:putative pentatricopeptide repeat-containing protein [Tanacetum coccineum]